MRTTNSDRNVNRLVVTVNYNLKYFALGSTSCSPQAISPAGVLLALGLSWDRRAQHRALSPTACVLARPTIVKVKPRATHSFRWRSKCKCSSSPLHPSPTWSSRRLRCLPLSRLPDLFPPVLAPPVPFVGILCLLKDEGQKGTMFCHLCVWGGLGGWLPV